MNFVHEPSSPSNFIRTIVQQDLHTGRVKRIVTRFPPEPNGYLHIGHARAIVLNFELADEFGGVTHLRFDDTNPSREDAVYVRAIIEDVSWLGYTWEKLHYASAYFERMHACATLLIQKNLAYVDDQSAQEIRETRGTLQQPGQNSPYRDRSVAENLDLFVRMRQGEFAEGTKVLRARLDMQSPNLNLRDPVLYRISHTPHHQTHDAWCIYPLYAFAHPLEDAIEGVTHSLCTLEFEDQRPFYDWVIQACEMSCVPQQIEFGRLNVSDTVMSKRKLKTLVEGKFVDGWDDPRLPTLAGLRRRGYPPEAIVTFIKETGLSKNSGVVDVKMLEHHVREQLQLCAPRMMAVLDPLKVTITNYPEHETQWLDAPNNSDDPAQGMRAIPFGRELYIERDDFMYDPPPKYHRLTIGGEVRLKHGYFIRVEHAVCDEAGRVVALHATYDAETKSGSGFTGRKVKSTIHWVDARHAVPAQFRLFGPLLHDAPEHATQPQSAPLAPSGNETAHPEDEDSVLRTRINPHSLTVVEGYVEPAMAQASHAMRFQLYRHGYFCVEKPATPTSPLVLNHIVSLKSSYTVR